MLIRSSAGATGLQLFPAASCHQLPAADSRGGGQSPPRPDAPWSGSSRPISHFNEARRDQHLFCAFHPQSRNEDKLPGHRWLMAASPGQRPAVARRSLEQTTLSRQVGEVYPSKAEQGQAFPDRAQDTAFHRAILGPTRLASHPPGSTPPVSSVWCPLCA